MLQFAGVAELQRHGFLINGPNCVWINSISGLPILVQLGSFSFRVNGPQNQTSYLQNHHKRVTGENWEKIGASQDIRVV
jgi:hypothetical protein